MPFYAPETPVYLSIVSQIIVIVNIVYVMIPPIGNGQGAGSFAQAVEKLDEMCSVFGRMSTIAIMRKVNIARDVMMGDLSDP